MGGGGENTVEGEGSWAALEKMDDRVEKRMRRKESKEDGFSMRRVKVEGATIEG